MKQKESRTITSGPFAQFGRALDVEDDCLIIGAPGIECGKVDLYRLEGSAWVFDTRLSGSCADGRTFGRSAALNNDHVVIGGPLSLGRSEVHVFSRTDETWDLLEVMRSEAQFTGSFGDGVAIRDNTVAITIPAGRGLTTISAVEIRNLDQNSCRGSCGQGLGWLFPLFMMAVQPAKRRMARG